MIWKDVVKEFAPNIGAALGGPLGGIATQFLAQKLLGRDVKDDSEMEMVIAGAGPELLAKIKEADAEFKRDVLKLRVEDRKSARNMYAAAKNKSPQIILSVVYTIGYFGALFGLMTDQLTIPAEHEPLFMILFGILTGAQTQILNFWFGSSSGSKDKTK